jgi:hypothetical protein
MVFASPRRVRIIAVRYEGISLIVNLFLLVRAIEILYEEIIPVINSDRICISPDAKLIEILIDDIVFVIPVTGRVSTYMIGMSDDHGIEIETWMS